MSHISLTCFHNELKWVGPKLIGLTRLPYIGIKTKVYKVILTNYKVQKGDFIIRLLNKLI